MSRRAFTSVLTAATVALALPLYAQDKGSQGQRPNSSGSSSGSAVSRPSGGGSSSGGGTSSSSGSSSASRPSGGNSDSAGSNNSGSGFREAPSRPERRVESRAVPRTAASSPEQQPRRVSPNGSTANASVSASGSDDQDGRRRAVPAYSRPRDGRPVIGSAVDRGLAPIHPGPIYGNAYSRYSYYYNRYPYGYYWPGYGFGVGYFYDPFFWGSYYAPYGYSGFYDPYAYGGYGGGGYAYGYGGGSYGRSRNYDVGGVRLKVKPHDGQVYVDGYYVGEVDSFDGTFQKLTLESGSHKIEIRSEGYLPEQFEVMVIPGETITYKGELKRRQ